MNVAVRPSDPYKINGLVFEGECDPSAGHVRWDALRSLWNGGMLLAALVLGPLYFHLVGARGVSRPVLRHALLRPLGRIPSPPDPPQLQVPEMARAHPDLSWHRGRHGRAALDHPHPRHARLGATQPDCHPFFAHKAGIWRDGFWYLHCRLVLDRPPRFDPGPEFRDDRFYAFLNGTAMLQQLPIALVLFALGGMPWLVWGVCVRVAACTTMHWYISRLAHTRGPQSWMVDGVGTMGYDVPLFAIPTMGESWHNNHHAFPASARHGLFPGQFDPGFRFIQLLETAWSRLGHPDAEDPAAAQGRALADRCAKLTVRRSFHRRRAPFPALSRVGVPEWEQWCGDATLFKSLTVR